MKAFASGGAGPRVYRPDSRFEIGLLASAGALAREVIEFRSHIATLFAGDFRASYRGAQLGVVWNFVLPLLPISVYVMLVSLRVFPNYEGLAPAVYIGFNVTLWFLFVGFIRQPMTIVRSRNAETMKTALPLSAAVASSFAQLAFDTLVRTGLVAVLTVAMGATPQLTAVAFPFVVLAGVAFFLGVGLLLSILNIVYPDIDRVVTIVLQYGIFLSGVIFPLSSIQALKALEVANPFAVFIHAARDLVFGGGLSQPIALAGWSLAGLLLLVFAGRFFYVMEYRIRGLS